MSRDELIEKMVSDVMEGFDFDRLHNVMLQLDWKWDIGNGEMTVPSTYRLISRAERLLREVSRYYGQDEAMHSAGTGGFMAELDGGVLSLTFNLQDSVAYDEDYLEEGTT